MQISRADWCHAPYSTMQLLQSASDKLNFVFISPRFFAVSFPLHPYPRSC